MAVMNEMVYVIGGEVALNGLSHPVQMVDVSLLSLIKTGTYYNFIPKIPNLFNIIVNLSVLKVYNPRTQGWSSRPVLPIPSFRKSCTGAETAIYCFGGSTCDNAYVSGKIQIFFREILPNQARNR
jgi:hypothetical protein